MKKTLIITLSVLLFPLLGVEVDAQSLPELYRLAKEEGQLNLYGGGPAALYTPDAKLFEERFPGIKVVVRGDFSNRLTGLIDSQIKQRKMEADIAVLQTIQDFVRWKKEGVLVPFKPEAFAKIPSDFKDNDGTYNGIAVIGIIYAYNPKLVDQRDVPKTAKDFLHSRFMGKIISTYPHDDDITLYLYYGIVEKHGWGFMDGLMKNKPSFVMGHQGVAQKIGTGDFAVTFDATTTQAAAEKNRGASLDVLIPEDTFPIWAQTVGIFKGAPHPNTAKLYLAWYLSDEQQNRMVKRGGRWSPRNDLAPPAGFRQIMEYRIADKFREFITDDSRIEGLRKKFEEVIGPVKGEAYR
ncbi:MAG: ABC transporter substrate-binding protein [Deltaproteobacteria bacterium]|nr:ABC transporter substrate-binding protein [Deltaproteobacteria bacterium]